MKGEEHESSNKMSPERNKSISVDHVDLKNKDEEIKINN